METIHSTLDRRVNMKTWMAFFWFCEPYKAVVGMPAGVSTCFLQVI